MILHKLISQFGKHRDDETFYALQAKDAIRWLRDKGVAIGSQTRALDLGCGHGVFGAELARLGSKLTFADEQYALLPEVASLPFRAINLDREDIGHLGCYDLVICSNVLEHLAKPKKFIDSIHEILNPNGYLFLSWTNWLSPWGGHEFSPFHYLGASRGHLLYDKVSRRQRKHTPYENLFPTSIGGTIRMIRANSNLVLRHAAPRYYTEFAFLVHIPVVREFLTWNCALLIQRKDL